MTQKAIDALKRLNNATDETQKQKIMADELSKAASEASKKVGGSVTNESVLGKTSEYIK